MTAHACLKYVEHTDELSKNAATNSFSSPVNAYQCLAESCPTKEIIEFECEFCLLNFCMKHRLQIDHRCAKLPSGDQQPTVKVAQPEFKFEMKKNVSEKNSQLAAKLIVMKLKQTAVGPPGLPEEDKFYCFVVNECYVISDSKQGHQVDKKPFYFSTKWPVGRCVEFLFDKFKLNKADLIKTRLFLEGNLVDSSLTIDQFVKLNSLGSAITLDLKAIH